MTQSVRDTMSSTIRVSSNEGYMAMWHQFGRGLIAILSTAYGQDANLMRLASALDAVHVSLG